jgi:hypothetical protein
MLLNTYHSRARQIILFLLVELHKRPGSFFEKNYLPNHISQVRCIYHLLKGHFRFAKDLEMAESEPMSDMVQAPRGAHRVVPRSGVLAPRYRGHMWPGTRHARALLPYNVDEAKLYRSINIDLVYITVKSNGDAGVARYASRAHVMVAISCAVAILFRYNLRPHNPVDSAKHFL